MFKNVTFKENGRTSLKKGIDTVADAIKVTLGYGGRNVLIGNGYGPVHPTKDGATIAKSIVLVEPIENMGATLIKEVAFKTLADAGDGTTTSTVLAQAIINAGIDALDKGANPIELKRGIEQATSAVVKHLKSLSKPVGDPETLVQIATISANNDPEIGRLIADAFAEVGKEGQIDVTDSKTHETYVDIVNGMKIDRGFTSPIFINNQKKRVCEFENPFILVSDRKLSTIKEIMPFLEKAINDKSQRPILLIVDRLEGEAASFIYRNRAEGKLTICVILAPEYGSDRTRALEDIAILTGATFISDDQGMSIEKAALKDCGSAEKVIIEEKSTLFVNGNGNAIDVDLRRDTIRAEIEGADGHQADKLKIRLSKMIGKIASLKVGAITQAEATEKKDRIDDALCATRAANEEGYLAGGGTAFLHCQEGWDWGNLRPDEQKGVEIVLEAIKQPFKQIMSNAGIHYMPGTLGRFFIKIATIFSIRIRRNNSANLYGDRPYGEGYNVKSEEWEDLFEAGVIDPTKVCRCAIENAASIASIFLTTECVVSDPKPKDY